MAGYQGEYTKCQLNRSRVRGGASTLLLRVPGQARRSDLSAATMANVSKPIEDRGTGTLPTHVVPSPLSGMGDRVLQLAQRLRFRVFAVSRPDFTHPDHRIFLGLEELTPLSLFRKIK